MTNREISRVITTSKDSIAGGPDMDNWIRFARQAEDAGIESVLLSFSNYEPDTLHLACALGCATKRLKFIVAYRLGLMQPATFVQQVNTLSHLIDGRISLNIVAGSSPAEQRGYGDYLGHDDRYSRAEEFMSICHGFWRDDGEFDFKGKYCREKAPYCIRGSSPRIGSPPRFMSQVIPAAQSDSHSPRVLAGCG